MRLSQNRSGGPIITEPPLYVTSATALHTKAEGHTIFGRASRVADKGVIGLRRVNPVIFVEDVLTPHREAPLVVRRADTDVGVNDRASIDVVQLRIGTE